MTRAGAGPTAVVIGGGVIGTACAHYLGRAGYKIVIVERGTIGGGSSHGNCGLVCPSHVLPLAEPGMVGRAVKSLFQRNSPFKIKPRLDPALWSWLVHFAARCNERDMMEAGRGIQPLLTSSLALYHDLVEGEGLECEFESRGLLFAYKDRAARDAYAASDRLMTESFARPARLLDGCELCALEPALRDDLAGGWYYHDDAHLRPDKLMSAWRARIEADGGAIREHHDFQGFETRNGRVLSARTSGGDASGDLFIVAAGAWTPRLKEHLGLAVPIQPGKGYSLTTPRPAACPAIPVVFPETRVVATPFQSGYRLGSTMEFSGYDSSIRQERLNLLKEGARPYLREPYCEPVLEEWYGWRPMTYDSLPIIDRAPRYSNVVIAAGHNMLGLSMAPATGKLVAEMATGATPHIDPRPYRADRF